MAGVDATCWHSQCELAVRYPGVVFPVFGLHPQCIPLLDDATIAAQLDSLASLMQTHRPVAIGETGMDGLDDRAREAWPRQERAFVHHLALARDLDLPVVLHLLRADAPALRILKQVGLPRRGGVVHAFSGSAEFARSLVALGLHLSFCGTLTLPQSRRLREAARATPLERLLIETDSPDQTPFQVRNEADGSARAAPIANRPAFVRHVAATLAEVRGEPLSVIAEATTANARRLFDLPSPCP